MAPGGVSVGYTGGARWGKWAGIETSDGVFTCPSRELQGKEEYSEHVTSA